MNTLSNWEGKHSNIDINYEVAIQDNRLLIDDIIIEDELPAYYKPIIIKGNELVHEEYEEGVSKADKLDYGMAVACGLLSGVIDSFWVGKFSFERAHEWGSEEVNDFVLHIANKTGYEKDDLAGAIRHLEQKYEFVGDKCTAEYGGGLQHHLRDFGHHFSIVGLICSILTQFTETCYGTDTNGRLLKVDVKNNELIGADVREKIIFGTINWFFHMVSDMAGSNTYAGAGTGIPGPVVSLMKEMSALPIFTDKKIGDDEIPKLVSKLFNGTLLDIKDENGKPIRFDLREELGVVHEIGRQAVPVIVNECLTRLMFFMRRFYNELKKNKIASISNLKKIEFENIMPFKNRITTRMLTVATGTFTAFDTADAAIRAAIENGGFVNNPAFFVDFALRINIVGIGRFVIACHNDSEFIIEDVKEHKEEKRRQKEEMMNRIRAFEQGVSTLNSFAITENQYRILCSLQYHMVGYDINSTKDNDWETKDIWRYRWMSKVRDAATDFNERGSMFITDEDKLYTEIAKEIKESHNLAWIFLIALEMIQFKPYFKLGIEHDKEFKKLKYKGGYIENVFLNRQDVIDQNYIKWLDKEYNRAYNAITGKNTKVIAGAISTGVVAVLTGGLSLTFAPAIAAVLAGESVAGLSGAALSSAALAYFGGGAVAAGGFGMAGGTAVITGGGALLGLTGSAGTATTIHLLSSDGYAANECAKLIAVSKEVFIHHYHAYGVVLDTKIMVERKMFELNSIVRSIKTNIDAYDNEQKEESKQQLKIIKKNMECYKKCDEIFQKILDNRGNYKTSKKKTAE